jgi:hypothetical protein
MDHLPPMDQSNSTTNVTSFEPNDLAFDAKQGQDFSVYSHHAHAIAPDKYRTVEVKLQIPAAFRTESAAIIR